MKCRSAVLLMLLLLLCAALALGESARVATPGGKLNVRREMDEKSRIALYVPNGSIVDVEEIGDEWTRIAYKGKSGYAKTDYLLLMRDMVGRMLYPDAGTVLILESPEEGAPLAGLCPAWEKAEILAYDSPWVKVRCIGETGGNAEGYALAEAFSRQNAETAPVPEYLTLKARAVQDTEMYRDAGKKHVSGSLKAGTEVLVTEVEETVCLVTGGVCGYVDCASLQLLSIDEEESLITSEAVAALDTAESYLGKKYKNFQKEELYGIVKEHESGYVCMFLNLSDRLRYVVLMSEKGKALMTARYPQFADPVEERLPEGEMHVHAEPAVLKVGEVLDVTVEAWTDSISYTLKHEDEELFSTGWVTHGKASYRPREEGAYELTVQARDDQGLERTETVVFQVQGSASTVPSETLIYSQKDGWWGDKAYRKSDLEQSGCAIFALAHILNRMGITGHETLPEELAVTYALCLTVDGTNNGRLIREAAEQFGFTTQNNLVKDKKEIRNMLEDGDLFTFSICRGHIAMVAGLSEDGSMVRVVDSAPLATFERIRNAEMYRQTRSGRYMPVRSLDDFPESRWYMELNEYGGLEYYLTLDYVARRGVRLVRPAAEE